MGGKLDGKKKRILIAALIVAVIGIILIVTDQPAEPAGSFNSSWGMNGVYSYNSYSAWGYDDYSDSYAPSGTQCFWCNDTGKCPDCRGLKDCQFVYGASHRCVNGYIYYGGDKLECSSCRGTGNCRKCDGTGRCPYCR